MRDKESEREAVISWEKRNGMKMQNFLSIKMRSTN